MLQSFRRLARERQRLPDRLALASCPFLLFFLVTPALAATPALDLTTSFVGFLALAIFTLAYALVMAEERLHMRKSKPVLVAAGIIWG
ncbi:Na(+)/H(+) antiporter NhaD [Halomonas elongata]|uniref:Na(+)/H(+) antiporter NhaD n=1 Tax=Halomonas elongata TaxID=2746 RepID=A0A1B8P6T1_HALEL|nr:Na(+)/H(+) antiporter NhaD [Halomonas elongata]